MNMSKLSYLVAAALAVAATAACEKNSGADSDENPAKFENIARTFVNRTVVPTYSALADNSQLLVEKLNAFKANKSQANLNAACEAFLDARKYWEKSEAFLFGAATSFGIDPHIDSWPLDEPTLKQELANKDKISQMEGEDGDVYAGETLGNALLGFHGVEYILFENGAPKTYTKISDTELVYAIAVAGDLRNNTFRLEVSWTPESEWSATTRERAERITEDLEQEYTLSGSSLNYGDNMLQASVAGSTYSSWYNVIDDIIDGCKTIADEVGTSKIGKPNSGEDEKYIESPYSYKSIEDFKDNMISIRNVYYGGQDAESLGSSSDNYNSSASLHGFLQSAAPDLDARIVAAIDNAISKVSAMKAPFVLNYKDASAKTAIEACRALDDVLSEAKTSKLIAAGLI